MNQLTTADFWDCYHKLPEVVRKLADANYELLRADLRHPSLHFKHVGRLWSVRVGIGYRASAVDGESEKESGLVFRDRWQLGVTEPTQKTKPDPFSDSGALGSAAPWPQRRRVDPLCGLANAWISSEQSGCCVVASKARLACTSNGSGSWAQR